MTRAEIRTLASVWLDDVSNGYFTTPQLNVWINQAQREVQKLLLNAGNEYYTTCAYTSTVADQSRYAFPTDFIKLLRLSYVINDTGDPDTSTYQRLYEITRNEQDNMVLNPSGDPVGYIINQSTFTLKPCPNRVLTLHMDYAYRVADLSGDSQVPDVPEDYHEYIAILAARDGFLRDGRDLGPIEAKLGYYEKLLKQNAQQRTQDSPRSVVRTNKRGSWF